MKKPELFLADSKEYMGNKVILPILEEPGTAVEYGLSAHDLNYNAGYNSNVQDEYTYMCKRNKRRWFFDRRIRTFYRPYVWMPGNEIEYCRCFQCVKGQEVYPDKRKPDEVLLTGEDII